MTLIDKLMARLEFDESWRMAEQRIANKGRNPDLESGARWQAESTARIDEALVKCVESLERECCCPGELHWGTKQPILCDPCEALEELKQAVEETK